MRIILVTLLMSFSLTFYAQNMEFYDGFENGTSNWTLTGDWGTSTDAFMGSFSLADSPTGIYSNMLSSSATMVNGVNLDTAIDAYIEVIAKYEIEWAFDFVYVEASHDQGNNWVTLGHFTGDSAWWRYTFSLSGFVGYTDVRCRLRFQSDQALGYDGIYVDEVKIYSLDEDINPPMIVHHPMPHYEGSLDQHHVYADIADYSGILMANLHYWVDTIYQGVVPGLNYSGNNWLFSIPQQSPGAWVDYYIVAVDSSAAQNTDTTNLYKYIAGNYIKYDNGNVDYVEPIGIGGSYDHAAVRISLNGITNVVSALIRTYDDPFITISDMEFHIWSNDSGVPGDDMVVPFIVTPQANIDHPHRITRIDLRPYADSLNNVTGDIFVGFKVPSGSVYVTETTPTIANRTLVKNFAGWFQHTSDFHFRVVTTEMTGTPDADFSYDDIADPLVDFTDLSTGTPVSWYWDFDDNGVFSTDQNPQHAFSNNGTYHVCLTVDNGIATSTSCQFVTVQNCVAPTAGFDYVDTWSPEILFNDTSLGYPTSWFWDFDDNGATWNYLNPMYTFTHNDTFHVCLWVTNALGSDSVCHDIIIDDYTFPTADFSYDPGNSPEIKFFDESTNQVYNSPDTWLWDFDDNGFTSILQDPVYQFSQNGVYNVCLIASNSFGSDTACNVVVIDSYAEPVAAFSWDTILSPDIQFIDESSDSLFNLPDSWYWDFGDGSTSTLSDPSHLYAQNGTYQVCLVVSNAMGSDSICHEVTVNAYQIPMADFSYNLYQPVVMFEDNSLGFPTSWSWDFGDGDQLNAPNPSHAYQANGTYYVCLTASNYLGSGVFCDSVSINYYIPPVAGFTYTILLDSIVYFHDESLNGATSWHWDFDYNGESSNQQHPSFTYSQTGTYHVCLTSTNSAGQDTACNDVMVEINSMNDLNESKVKIYPNPFTEKANIELPFEMDAGDCHITIFNALGQNVEMPYSISGNYINLYKGDLKAGSYLLVLRYKQEFFRLNMILMNDDE